MHQLLSQNELHYFYLLEWSPAVVDIREQYPLWPLEETQEIAIELGLRPGDARVDLEAVKALYRGTYASFASQDVAERLAGSVAGTILPVLVRGGAGVDSRPLGAGEEEIFFNAARLDRSMALNAEDYEALAEPRLERIAENIKE